MCRIRNCKRHEYDKTLCLRHYREAVEAGVPVKNVTTWNPRDTRNKEYAPDGSELVRIVAHDSIELMVNDETTELETR